MSSGKNDIVISVKDLSKVYRLGTIGTGSLRQDLTFWWHKNILKKQNLFFESATNSIAEEHSKGILWALRDVTFDVNRGEALGIIGSNGSGKSTMLKIISRIVKPTRGTVNGKGKVASLLEVGTGFHPELTGRENIYISGYTLGMSKAEINNKFDEIVEFSGIENFIDTPVKRYSSGMYVRLAFAVGAHLEPDILIVDEVLAVGDADFQKKCLGKMREVSHADGRTIIFVSHNMQAVKNLCDKALWLEKGIMRDFGQSSDVINNYVSSNQKHHLGQEFNNPEAAPGNEFVRFKKVELVPEFLGDDEPLDVRTPITIRFQFWNLADKVRLNTGLVLFSYAGECIFDLLSEGKVYDRGLVEGECKIPGNFLNDGSYYISINVVRDTSVPLFNYEECLAFEVEDYRGDLQYYEKWWGAVRPKFPFSLTQLSNSPVLI